MGISPSKKTKSGKNPERDQIYTLYQKICREIGDKEKADDLISKNKIKYPKKKLR